MNGAIAAQRQSKRIRRWLLVMCMILVWLPAAVVHGPPGVSQPPQEMRATSLRHQRTGPDPPNSAYSRFSAVIQTPQRIDRHILIAVFVADRACPTQQAFLPARQSRLMEFLGFCL